MKLSPHQKSLLIRTAKHVYQSYLALDFLKNKPFHTEIIHNVDGSATAFQSTLFDIVKSRIQNPLPSMLLLQIEDKEYSLHIQAESNSNHLVVQLKSAHQPDTHFKLPKDYITDEQIGDLLVNKPFIIEIMPNNDLVVSLSVTAEHTIGGAKKYDLYRSHLVTLFNMIHKIEHEDDISSLLIALATGSGKTYVQALWLGILALANFNAVFAIPNNLIRQFHKDLNRLLPNSIIDKIRVLRDKDDPSQISIRLNRLQGSGNLFIASSKLILDNHYDQIMAASPNQTCLIFDEQHLLMANESRRMRLLTLSQKFMSVFLTATPDQETYNKSGKRPVAIMSSGQKQKAGQGQFPEITHVRCESISDKHKKQIASGQIGFFTGIAERLILSFDSAIQKPCSSAVRAIFEELPYILKRKNETDLRWRLQVPMASKMLCIIENNEALVNCCHYLQASDDNCNLNNIYQNGNFVERGSVSMFFGIPDVDLTVIGEEHAQREKKYFAQLTPEERTVLKPIVDSSLKQRLHANMFHYLVEYVLSDLSGRTLIEHNKLRKKSSADFKQLIIFQYQRRDYKYYFNKLAKEIDVQGADVIAKLLAKISEQLGTVITNNHNDQVMAFTNNWFLDDQLINSMGTYFQEIFSIYAKKYAVMGVMSGMDEAETPIKESKPFLGLQEERYSLYENSGMQATKAKRRKRTSIELLNDKAEESNFTPYYEDGITEEIADKYFEYGFCVFYVSNKKSEGYSDQNLHTIINMVEQSHDLNNSPNKEPQIIGRARGLDDTVLPTYICGLGHNQEAGFDLKLLAKDDYYPELFQAQKKFDESYIPVLGEQVGKDIIAWYHQHQDIDESIDPDELKKKVLHLVAAALRRLNIQNSHQIHISRAQLPKVIYYAMQKINHEIAHTQRPYQLSLFLRVVGSMINFICECYFTLLRLKPWIAMFWLSWELSKKTREDRVLNAHAARQKLADTVYLKIIRQAHFKDLIAQSLIAAEFKNWLARKINAVKTIVDKSLLFYLKLEIKAEVDAELSACMIAVFEKMIVPEKQGLFRAKLQQFSGIVHFLQTNRTTLDSMQKERNDEEFSEYLLSLFYQIPGLEALCATDMVNYPRQVKETIDFLQHMSLNVLVQDAVLQEQSAVALTAFFQTELPSYLGCFFTYPDQIKVATALLNEPTKVRTFVDQYLAECLAQPDQNLDLVGAFTQLCRGLDLDPSVQVLPQKLQHVTSLIENYQRACIVDTIYSELLPCLVNLYPQHSRARLLSQITRDKLDNLLTTQQTDLQSVLATNNPQQISAFFFTRLCTMVPTQIDIEQEKQDAANFFIQQTKGSKGIYNGMVYVADKLTGSNFNLVNKRIEAVLITEPFFNSISLLLPYHHWCNLKLRFQSEPAQLSSLAQSLAKYVDSKTLKLTPELLLREINTAFATEYCSAQEYGSKIGEDLIAFGKGNATHCATPELHSQLATLIRNDILPILAVYLQEDALKELFLARTYTDQELCVFFVRNIAQFKNLNRLSTQQQQTWVQAVITQLCPNLVLTENSIVVPTVRGAICKQALEFKLKTVFCMSEFGKNKLKTFFNTTDGQALDTSLKEKETAEHLVRIFSTEDSVVNVEAKFAQIRETIPNLNNVYTLKERIDKFPDTMQKYADLGLTALDNTKVSTVIAEQISPILQHSQFKNLINLYMGNLKQNELTLILSARGVKNPRAAAELLLEFKKLINHYNIEQFKQKFMYGDDSQPYEFEHTCLKEVLENFYILAEEVTKCHGYYQQHDAKGVQNCDTTPPAFFSFLSNSAKEIRVPAYDTFMSRFARKIFFIQGVRLGLPKAGQVYADSHKETIDVLKNINDNLLSPLWWTTNTFSMVYNLISGVKNLWLRLQEIVQAFFVRTRVLLGGHTVVTQADIRRAIQIDYNLSALNTAQVINELKPLSSEQVAAANCPKDVIKHVERKINKLPGHRLRLFELRREEELREINRHTPILA